MFRLGILPDALVSVTGVPRVIDRTRLVDLDDFQPAPDTAFLPVAFSPVRRAELARQAESLGMRKADALVDPTAILPRSMRIGAGTYVNAGVVIGGMSIIGEGVLVNRAASLGHHTVLGDFVSIGPGATLAGNIHVGAGSVIGAGAVIQPDVRIGENVIVAAGAVVRKHIPDNTLVAGNPAMPKRFVPQRSSLNVEGGE